MKRICIAAALISVLLLPTSVFAQAGKTAAPTVILAYYEDASGVMAVKDDKGADVDLVEGLRLQKGWTLITDKGDLAELKLDPNGTIVKISQKTNFKIESLQGSGSDDKNAFSVALGKIRTVAGKATGNEKYTFKGSSAVCGVRGTDFGMEVNPGTSETAFVFDGLIDYTKLDSGEVIEIGKGMIADAMAAVFQAAQMTEAMIQELKKDIEFQKLNPSDVPGHAAAPAPQTAAASSGDAVAAAPKPTEPAAAAAPAAATPAKDDFMAPIIAKLKEIIGLEIGSITIGDVTYSKAVAQPVIDLGKFKAAFYLPIIYSGDMFDASDWYKPEGNNEWSFGTDVTRTAAMSDLDYVLAITKDAASDVFLKIRYIEWGDNRDPIFFKLGNLSDITIGHGLIMRDFANDADFPSIRRLGLNLGLDMTQWGFEAMANDVSASWPWDIVGGRVYIRPAAPAFKLAFGASMVADLNPAKNLDTATAALMGNPMFLNPGLDLDLPIIETDPFSIIAFTDGSLMMPLFTTTPDAAYMTSTFGRSASNPIAAGLMLDAFWQPNNSIPLKNWGVAAGLMGNVLIADWRLEFRDYTGFFKPQFYSTGYELLRTQYLYEMLTYLANPTSSTYDVQTMGIYGEGGFKISKAVDFTMSYFWPWTWESGSLVTDDTDRFTLKLDLYKGLIPIPYAKDAAISLSYERTKFVTPYVYYAQKNGTLTGAPAFSLVDANTVVSAEVSYTAASMLDIVVLYSAVAERDSSGNVVYDTATTSTDPLAKYLPKMTSSISIETRIHF